LGGGTQVPVGDNVYPEVHPVQELPLQEEHPEGQTTHVPEVEPAGMV